MEIQEDVRQNLKPLSYRLEEYLSKENCYLCAGDLGREKGIRAYIFYGSPNRHRWCGPIIIVGRWIARRTATAGSDVVQSGRPIFDDFFQHLWPYIGNNTANVVFQMVKRLWLIRIDQ
ncbi:hypothetical protein TNCV_570711 [Trichonephila clavipes]|nr:hypothetical protein TNCV_570711 [Trichonephila clavipes]